MGPGVNSRVLGIMEHVFSRIRSNRVLIVRIGALGDVLLTRRLTHALSRAGLRSTLFAPERHASLLRADPWIDEVIDSESPRVARVFEGEWPEELGGFGRAVAISGSEAVGRAAAQASESSVRVPPDPWREDRSIALQWCEAAGVDGALAGEPPPPLPTDPIRALAVEATLIHPGSGAPRKNWRVDRFVELSLALEGAGHRVMWIRGPAEMEFPAEAARFPVIDRAPLAVLAATLACCRLFVGNDSGVSHLAAAVAAPTVPLFGPTSALVWRPDGPHVLPVAAPGTALETLGVDRVLAAIEELARLTPATNP